MPGRSRTPEASDTPASAHPSVHASSDARPHSHAVLRARLCVCARAAATRAPRERRAPVPSATDERIHTIELVRMPGKARSTHPPCGRPLERSLVAQPCSAAAWCVPARSCCTWRPSSASMSFRLLVSCPREPALWQMVHLNMCACDCGRLVRKKGTFNKDHATNPAPQGSFAEETKLKLEQAYKKKKASQAKYRASKKGKAAKAKYRASEKGQAARAAYEASEKGQATRAAYEASEEGQATRAAYDASELAKIQQLLSQDELSESEAKNLVSNNMQHFTSCAAMCAHPPPSVPLVPATLAPAPTCGWHSLSPDAPSPSYPYLPRSLVNHQDFFKLCDVLRNGATAPQAELGVLARKLLHGDPQALGALLVDFAETYDVAILGYGRGMSGVHPVPGSCVPMISNPSHTTSPCEPPRSPVIVQRHVALGDPSVCGSSPALHSSHKQHAEEAARLMAYTDTTEIDNMCEVLLVSRPCCTAREGGLMPCRQAMLARSLQGLPTLVFQGAGNSRRLAPHLAFQGEWLCVCDGE